jgi:threonine dehydrogenase-like Zn-dependent dehydrogenase
VTTSVWFASPRQVELHEEALPPVGPRDVRVEAIASAISHGTEMLVFRGQVPNGLELDLPTLHGSFAFPIKYGYASVGRVAETGSEVLVPTPGELVFVHHPHQAAYVVPADVETATNVVLDAAPRLGERVAIFGQGTVGLLITQLVRRTGAAQITIVDPIARRRDLALRVGADEALASGSVLDGAEFDLAIEASGHPAALDEALRSVAFGGAVTVCSWYGTKPVSVTLGGAFHRRRLRIVSSQVSTIDASLQPRWSRQRRLDLARDFLSELELTSLISHRFPIENAADAYALLDAHPEETVQVVLTYGSA